MPLVAVVVLAPLLPPLPLWMDRPSALLVWQLKRPSVPPGVGVALPLPMALLLAAPLVLLPLDVRQSLLAPLQDA